MVIWGVGWGEGEGWSHTNHLARFSGSSSEKGRGGVQGRISPPPPCARRQSVDERGGLGRGGTYGGREGSLSRAYRNKLSKMSKELLLCSLFQAPTKNGGVTAPQWAEVNNDATTPKW